MIQGVYISQILVTTMAPTEHLYMSVCYEVSRSKPHTVVKHNTCSLSFYSYICHHFSIALVQLEYTYAQLK